MHTEDKDQRLTLSVDHMQSMLREAAREGATEALNDLGLGDFSPKDIADMRSLVDGWRETKTYVWSTLVKAGTVLLLGFLAVGASVKTGLWHG
jgi:hypothetical protein